MDFNFSNVIIQVIQIERDFYDWLLRVFTRELLFIVVYN